jgi:uncharacterized protein YutE (UPF0331/DUF86 family)
VNRKKLDWQSTRAKLDKIQALLRDLTDLGDFDLERMRQDRIAGLAAERILTLLVDLAAAVNSHISAAQLGYVTDTYADSFRLAAETGALTKELAERLRPSAGMRNILVHGYIDIDRRRVVEAIPAAIEQYGLYVEQVARWLLDRQKVSGGM